MGKLKDLNTTKIRQDQRERQGLIRIKWHLNHRPFSKDLAPLLKLKEYQQSKSVWWIDANFDPKNIYSTDRKKNVVKKMLGFYQVKPNILGEIEDRI